MLMLSLCFPSPKSLFSVYIIFRFLFFNGESCSPSVCLRPFCGVGSGVGRYCIIRFIDGVFGTVYSVGGDSTIDANSMSDRDGEDSVESVSNESGVGGREYFRSGALTFFFL